MYVVFAEIGTGEPNVTDCHPLPDSPTNVACLSSVPVADHRLPTCVPVFVVLL